MSKKLFEAGIGDIPTIQGMAAVVWPVTFEAMLSREQIAYMMDMMYSREALEHQIAELGHRYLIAMEREEYLGYLSYETGYKDSRTKIHKIYILPAAQGRGLGRLFVERAEKIARTAGNALLTLNVNRDNRTAIAFYQKMGFDIEESYDIDIGNGFLMTDHVMTKKLG